MANIDRAQWLADARALLDFIEANPELPVPEYSSVEISYHPMPYDQSDAEKRAAIDAVANMLGAEVQAGVHYEVGISFGSASYRAVAVMEKERKEWDKTLRIRASLAETGATEAVR